MVDGWFSSGFMSLNLVISHTYHTNFTTGEKFTHKAARKLCGYLSGVGSLVTGYIMPCVRVFEYQVCPLSGYIASHILFSSRIGAHYAPEAYQKMTSRFPQRYQRFYTTSHPTPHAQQHPQPPQLHRLPTV